MKLWPYSSKTKELTDISRQTGWAMAQNDAFDKIHAMAKERQAAAKRLHENGSVQDAIGAAAEARALIQACNEVRLLKYKEREAAE